MTKRDAASVYIGTRTCDGEAIIHVDGERLNPKRSQKLINHSPDGFNWGYCGSGPAQLALGILLDYFGELSPDVLIYQRFKERAIATIPQSEDNWSITGAEIEEHVAAIRVAAGSAA